jgi:hypothetical protein
VFKSESSEKLLRIVNETLKASKEILDSHEPLWAELISQNWLNTSTAYIDNIKRKVTDLLTLLSSSLTTHAQRLTEPSKITITEDIATKINKNIGGSFWLGVLRNTKDFLLSQDSIQNNFYNINQEINHSKNNIEISVEVYFSNINSQVDEYETSDKPKLIVTEHLQNSYNSLSIYSVVASYINQLQETIEGYKKELTSWDSEFDRLWAIFRTQFKQELLKQKNDKSIRTSLDYHDSINRHLKRLKGQWLEGDAYQAHWLRQLHKYNSGVAMDFENYWRQIKLNKVFDLPPKLDRSEWLILLISLGASLTYIPYTLPIFLLGGGIVMRMSQKRRREGYEQLEAVILKEIDFIGSQAMEILKGRA